MAMGIPSITSPLANQALQAKEGEAILVAATPAEYAALILDLLDHPETARHIGQKGLEYVRDNFSWEAETAKIERLISKS